MIIATRPAIGIKKFVKPVNLGIGLVLAIVTLVVLRPIDSFDIWWHLNSGLWMLVHHEVMDHDVWSFTVHGADWINVAWLFQVFIAVFYKLLGNWGLLLVKSLLIFSIYLAYWAGTSKRAGILAYLLAVLLLMPFMVGHFHLRPHMIELLLLASIIILSQSRWGYQHVIIGLLLLVVWANTHASVVVGATALSVQAVFGHWREEKKYPERFLVAAIFSIPLVLTPYGLSLIKLLLAHGDSESIDYYIIEWVNEGYFPELLWIIIAIVVVGGLSRRLKMMPAEWYLLGFFFFYAIQFKRFELELSVVLLAPLSVILQSGMGHISARSGQRMSLLIVVLFMLSHITLYYTNSAELGRFIHKRQAIELSNYPHITTQQLVSLSDKMGRKVRVLNDYGMGGYLAFASDSRVAVFVDGRMSTVYPERFVIPQYENKSVIRKTLADRYNVDAILLGQSSAIHMQDGGSDWRRIGYDSASVLYVREDIAQQFNIAGIGFDPSSYNSAYARELNARYRDETLKYTMLYPRNPVALNHLAVFASSAVENAEQARDVLGILKQVLEIDPDNVFGRATLALLYSRWQAFDPSFTKNFIEVLPPAKDMGSEVDISYFRVFAQQLLKLDLPAIAKSYLYPESMERRRNMDEYPGVWMDRALMHHALGEMNKVDNCLDIARELLSDDQFEALKKLDTLREVLGK
jgi:hypothetical protein